MTVAIVVGTRPEIIKLAPVVRALGEQAQVVYTGQHYDETLAGNFFDAFGMPRPGAVVEVGGRSRGEQIGVAVEALSRVWLHDRPNGVVVQGDTNTALAGALAANAVGIPLAHVEAGLRSFDRAMPEEHNRVLVDHVSDLLLTPTSHCRDNLVAERITQRVVVTGNTVVEAVQSMLPGPDERQCLVEDRGLEPNHYVLATIHRPENTDDAQRLAVIIEQLVSLDLPVAFPVHPRTLARLQSFGISHLLNGLMVSEPVGYREFLGLSAESALLVSDSGGVQEEASVYKRPVVVVRRSTERPEVLGTFTSMAEPHEVFERATQWLKDLAGHHERLAATPSPYGDGTAGRISADEIRGMVG